MNKKFKGRATKEEVSKSESNNTNITKLALFVTMAGMLILPFSVITEEAEASTMNLAETRTQTSSFIMTSEQGTPVANTVLSTEESARQNAIQWPEIKAESAIVYDPLEDRVLYQKNADDRHSMASLIKIMTAAVVNEFLSMNPKLGEKTVKITSTKSFNAADRLLINNSLWHPKDLVNFMLIGSSNKAAESLGRNIIPNTSFISYMNFVAKRYGLTETVFYNETGLPILNTKTKKESPAGITTAREMAKLFWSVINENPGLMDITAYDKAEFSGGKTLIEVKNTNKILNEIPIKYGKTGFTEFAGGNLAIVLQKDEMSKPYVIVVLGSTEDDRFSDVEALASTTMVNFR